MTKYQPLHDRILIRQFGPAKQSTGGIILPETTRPHVVKGEVLAVGPGKVLNSGVLVPVTLKPGQVVCYHNYGVNDLPGENTLTILQEHEILCTVEG